MLLNKCSKCGANSWETTICDGCKNGEGGELNSILKEYMKAHDNDICMCGKLATMRVNTQYAVRICGKCEYNGVLNVVNGTVLVEKDTYINFDYLKTFVKSYFQ